MLPHAGALVCPPPRHRLSGHSPHTLWLIFNTIPTTLAAFPPRFAALPKPRSDPCCRSNPIAHRVRRKRQRLPPSLLIENASVRYPAPPQKSAPRRFRSRLATIRQDRKAQNDVSSGTETDRGGATCALGKMESCSASEASGIGPRFPHFHSQIFRFSLSFALTEFAATV